MQKHWFMYFSKQLSLMTQRGNMYIDSASTPNISASSKVKEERKHAPCCTKEKTTNPTPLA